MSSVVDIVDIFVKNLRYVFKSENIRYWIIFPLLLVLGNIIFNLLYIYNHNISIKILELIYSVIISLIFGVYIVACVKNNKILPFNLNIINNTKYWIYLLKVIIAQTIVVSIFIIYLLVTIIIFFIYLTFLHHLDIVSIIKHLLIFIIPFILIGIILYFIIYVTSSIIYYKIVVEDKDILKSIIPSIKLALNSKIGFPIIILFILGLIIAVVLVLINILLKAIIPIFNFIYYIIYIILLSGIGIANIFTIVEYLKKNLSSKSN